MKTILLTQGLTATVDDEDYERTSPHKWHATKRKNTAYAQATFRTPAGRKEIKLHRYILQLTDPAIYVDHIDGNGLNCCRSNMRLSDAKTNQRNRGKPDTTAAIASRFKGVSWHCKANKWQAKIVANDGQQRLGFFECQEEAARAYDYAAIERFGQFAMTNERLGLLRNPAA